MKMRKVMVLALVCAGGSMAAWAQEAATAAPPKAAEAVAAPTQWAACELK